MAYSNYLWIAGININKSGWSTISAAENVEDTQEYDCQEHFGYDENTCDVELDLDSVYYEYSSTATKNIRIYFEVYNKKMNDQYELIASVDKTISNTSGGGYLEMGKISIKNCKGLKIVKGYSAEKGIIYKSFSFRVYDFTCDYTPKCIIKYCDNDGGSLGSHYINNTDTTSAVYDNINDCIYGGEFLPYEITNSSYEEFNQMYLPYAYKDNKIFKGWALTPNATSPVYEFSSNYINLKRNSTCEFDGETYLDKTNAPYIPYSSNPANRTNEVIFYAVWEENYYVSFYNTIAPESSKGLITTSVPITLTAEKQSWAYGGFELNDAGYWNAQFKSQSVPAQSQICSKFSFSLRVATQITIKYQYDCTTYNNVIGWLSSDFKESYYGNPGYSTGYTSTADSTKNAYLAQVGHFKYLIHTGYASNDSSTSGTRTYNFTLPPGDYSFFAYYQGNNNVNGQTTACYFRFKITGSQQIIGYDPSYCVRYSVSSGSAFSISDADISNMTLTTTKYNFNGWYDGTNEEIDILDLNSNIRGPNAIFKTNTTKYYDEYDTIQGTNIISDINLYSIEQSKYRAVFHKYPHQQNGSDNLLSSDSNHLIIKGDYFYSFPSAGTSVTRTNYVFKGWTYSNSYTTYNSNYDVPEFCIAGETPELTNTLINVAQEGTNYFDIHFYPVWNEKMHIIYQDPLHSLTNTKSYYIEKGTDYTINSNDYGSGISTYITNNSSNEKGYNFVGWVLENQNDNLCTPYIATDYDYLYYPDTSITLSNFNANKANLYTRNKLVYTSASSGSFSSSQIYYRRLTIYRSSDIIESINTALNLYAVWQRKYKTRYYNANSQVITSQYQENLTYYGNSYINTPTSSSSIPSKTGYVFKGWTIYNDSSHIDYSAYYLPDISKGFYEHPSTGIEVDDALINQAASTRSGGASGYFYIDFYPVYNPCYSITFISRYPGVSDKTKINTMIAERGEDFTVLSSHLPSNISNDGYNLYGWTERSPSNSNVVGINADIKSSTWYESVTFSGTAEEKEAAFQEQKFLLYTKSGNVYTKIISGVNPSTLSYNSNITYYKQYTDLEPAGDTISGAKIYTDLIYYAIWRKKYQVIFKNASGGNISSTFYESTDDVTTLASSRLPTKTLATPTINCTNPTPNSGTNYGFQYNSSISKWESLNTGQSNSYSLGRFSFTAGGRCLLIITMRNNSETNYDYGIFSKLNQELSLNQSKDSDSLIAFTGKLRTNECKFYYEISTAGTYTFDVKYIKNGSINTNDDKLIFSTSFVNLGKKFEGWTLNSQTTIFEDNPSSFFENSNIPIVADSQVNNAIEGGPFQIIYYPVWSSQYSIIFNNPDKNEIVNFLNNISYGGNKSFSFNSNIIDSYTSNGYFLEGWSTLNNKIGPTITQGSNDYNFNDTVEGIVSNLTLYLILKNKYQIYFYNVDKTSVYNTINNLEAGDSVSVPNDPSNANFDFVGWVLNNTTFNHYYALSSENKNLVHTNGSVDLVANNNAIRNSSGYFEIKYYSVWNKKYNILFKDDLHNTNQNNSFCVSYNNTADFSELSKPTTTTDNGYTLIGWRKSPILSITYTEVTAPTSGPGILRNYGFETVDSKNYIWKSKNPRSTTTYSLGRFSFTATKPCTLIITAQNDSNSVNHYGIFSELDKQLSPSYEVDNSNIQATGFNTRNEYTVTYNITTTGLHSFDVKYRTDIAGDITYCNNLIFNISFDIPPDNHIGPNVSFSNSLDKNNDYPSILNVTSDLVFYAIQKKKYRLVFVNDADTTLSTITTNINTGEPFYDGDDDISVPNISLTKSSYILKGWTTSSSNDARNYLTRITNNFYELDTSDIEIKDEDSATRNNFTDYFNIKFYPVWNKIFTITFKNTISTATSSHSIEAGENFDFSEYAILSLEDETNAYKRLGWTLRDYTNEAYTSTICGPSAYKSNDDYLDNGIINASLITSNLILYAIQLKKYTLLFYNSSGRTDEIYEDYYLNDEVQVFPDSYKDGNSIFKGWTLDSTKTIYNSTNDSVIYTEEEGLPDITDNPWFEIDSEEEVEAGTNHIISNSNYYDKIKCEIVGWNTTRSFPISEAPTYNLTGESITVNSNINFYLACKKRYALEINDIDISNAGNYDITISRGSAIYESEDDIDYYNYGQNLNIVLTPKDHKCFINKKYDNDTNSSSITMSNHNRTLTFNITLSDSTYDTSSISTHHKLLYSLGNGIKFTPIIRIQNKQHDNTYCNNSFYVNNIALGDYDVSYITSSNYIQKTIPLVDQYYYLGDTITCEFKHTINSAPALQYYINQILFYENGTWYSSGEYVSKSRSQINSGFSNNYATYTYTHTVTLEDIEEDGKAIQIIPYYVPYNNIIHVKSDQGFIKLNDAPSYTVKTWTGDTYLNEGYIYLFNEQSSNLQISLTNRDNYIPIQFKYQEPSTSLQTCSIYDFLNYENPNTILPKFYYSDKYTFHSIGLNLSTTDINTYHSDLYELQELGYFGGLQRVEILSKPLNKITITKPNTIINSDSTDNSLIFYINSSNLLNNSIEYSIQDVKDSGMSFKELIIDTSSGTQTINKSQIVDEGLSLPTGWTRQQTTDHTDIITYTNNNFSARNGYIDYITITFAESLPLFYLDSKAIQLYWEGTKAEGLYWENIKLL